MQKRFPYHKHGNCKGYTLIEICTALFIVTLLTSLALPSCLAYLRQEALRREAESLQQAARLARHEAMTKQKPQVLVFTSDGWRVEGRVTGSTTTILHKTVHPEFQSIETHTWNIPLSCMVQGDTDENWKPAHKVTWRFSPDGTAPPLRVRLISTNNGWMELCFNPLTALATEEASYFP